MTSLRMGEHYCFAYLKTTTTKNIHSLVNDWTTSDKLNIQFQIETFDMTSHDVMQNGCDSHVYGAQTALILIGVAKMHAG